ncbi:MAG: hypothetical protein PVI50_03905 [Gammaproteobacteria bacterium]|jgi:hypothetical protein
MTARIRSGTFVLLYCVFLWSLAPEVTAAGRYLVTVLRSHDPAQVHELLGLRGPPAVARPDMRQRDYRTSGYGQRHHDRWQVMVSEGQTAFVATGRVTSRLSVPWIALTRRGPVPHVRLDGHDRVDGVFVTARRPGNDVQVELEQFTDRAGTPAEPGKPGTGLRTVLHGRPGQWLDAGGSLLLDAAPDTARRYSLRHSDPSRFRVLVRVDILD